MNARFSSLPPSSQNPIVQAISLIAGTILLVGAFFIGAFLLVIALALALVVGAGIMARVWWLKRKFIKAAKKSGDGATHFSTRSGSSTGSVIDVEYTVIEESDAQNRSGERKSDNEQTRKP